MRQLLLKKMVLELGYPKEFMAVEKELGTLPHLTFFPELPERRIDILCFQGKNMEPLLLVECKAEPLSSTTFDQVLGYNLYVSSPFVAIVNQKEVKFWNALQKEWVSFFPSYAQLMELVGSERKAK